MTGSNAGETNGLTGEHFVFNLKNAVFTKKSKICPNSPKINFSLKIVFFLIDSAAERTHTESDTRALIGPLVAVSHWLIFPFSSLQLHHFCVGCKCQSVRLWWFEALFLREKYNYKFLAFFENEKVIKKRKKWEFFIPTGPFLAQSQYWLGMEIILLLLKKREKKVFRKRWST